MSSDYKGCGADCVYQNELAQPTFVSGPNAGMRSFFRAASSDYLRASYSEGGEPPSGAPAYKDPMDVHSLQKYYDFNVSQVAPALVSFLRPFGPDDETQHWLHTCRSDLCTSLMASLLRRFMSVTDVNGLLRRGQMFIFSDAMARDLLFGERGGVLQASSAGSPAPLRPLKLGKLLDVGAGDGGVTAQFAPYFESVTATEVSSQMVKRLREKGYTVHQTPFINESGLPGVAEGSFDVVSIFNVLDRCDHPGALLSDARRLLNPVTGRLILAVVLPFSEFVEDGTLRRRPYGQLPMAGYRCSDGVSFEASMSTLIQRAIIPAGFDVVSIAKLPYLCRGDRTRPYYVLADAIMVCKPRIGGELPTRAADASAILSSSSSSSSSAAEARIPLRPNAYAAASDVSAFASSSSSARMAFSVAAPGMKAE